MKCSCVWLVVSVGAHSFHIESGSWRGVPYIYIYIRVLYVSTYTPISDSTLLLSPYASEVVA